MSGELYVMQLIRRSTRARNSIASLISERERERQIARLRDPREIQRIANTLGCREEVVFMQLAQRVQAAFTQRPWPHFTGDHLERLVDRPIQMRLGSVLHCHYEDVLGKLFDTSSMLHTLSNVGGIYEDLPDAGVILHQVIRSRSAIEHALLSADWGSIVKRDAWIRPEAIAALKEFAARQGRLNIEPVRALAAAITELQPGASLQQEEETMLDWLALTYLRQRLQQLVNNLRDESAQLADEAAKLAPSLSELRRLPVWLALYERGAVRRILPYLVAPTKPLAVFLTMEDCRIPPTTGRLEPEKHMIVAEDFVFTKNVLQMRFPFVVRREYATFGVYGIFRGDPKPRLVLRCHNVPIAVYRHLKQIIPALYGATLSTVGTSAGMKLLNTSIAVPDRFLNLLSKGVERLGGLVSACLVLYNIPLPKGNDVPWREDLRTHLPYNIPSKIQDTSFIGNVRTIVDRIENEYRERGKQLDVITSSS